MPGGSLTLYPDLLFLAFLDFLAFLLFEEFLVFLSVFRFFSKDFRGSEETENPCIFGGFPCICPKKRKEKKIRVRAFEGLFSLAALVYFHFLVLVLILTPSPRKKGVGEGLAEKVGKGLAKGWRRVGKGLAKGWRRVGGFPCTLRFWNSPRHPFRDTGLRLHGCCCSCLGHIPNTAATFWKKFRTNSGKTLETL